MKVADAVEVARLWERWQVLAEFLGEQHGHWTLTKVGAVAIEVMTLANPVAKGLVRTEMGKIEDQIIALGGVLGE